MHKLNIKQLGNGQNKLKILCPRTHFPISLCMAQTVGAPHCGGAPLPCLLVWPGASMGSAGQGCKGERGESRDASFSLSALSILAADAHPHRCPSSPPSLAPTLQPFTVAPGAALVAASASYHQVVSFAHFLLL